MKLLGSIFVQVLFACAYARPSSECDSMEYFDPEEQKCHKCTLECPANEMILTLCGKYTDTKCGPFHFDLDFNWPSVQEAPIETEATKKAPQKTGDNQSTESIDDRQWFTVAMVLLGLLCLVCFCIVGYIIACCFCKKNEDKEIIYDPVFVQAPSSEEPRYVEVFQSSRDRLKGRNSLMQTDRFSTFQSTSALPLLQSQNSANIYVNCMEYLPNVELTNKSKDTNDYVYLD